jgi:hypothetical protein
MHQAELQKLLKTKALGILHKKLCSLKAVAIGHNEA